MNDLERKLLDTLLAGDDPFLKSLRSQLEQSVVVSKAVDESGFFIYFSVPPSVPRVATTGRVLIDDVRFELAGLEHGGEIILFVDDGYVHIFEGYLHAEKWPVNPELTRVFYDTDPRDFKLLRKAWGVD